MPVFKDSFGEKRRLPVGAEVRDRGVHFRVWAPACRTIAVVIGAAGGENHPLVPEGNGYFSGLAEGVGPGALYRFRPDEGDAYPDPASRFQPEGPHGPSQVVDPGAFSWADGGWKGIPREDHVLYEMHIGTATPEGSWRAAAARLPDLKQLGVTTIQMMPVADFPGRFGWGYDGAALFAPTRLYGGPDDLRHFVDAAHGEGLAVILDVVYNHFGIEGSYLTKFAPAYLSDRHGSDWGNTPNFDGKDCGPVREFVLANAAYWIDEYHFDGLRLDATDRIRDESAPHILAGIGAAVHAAAGGRQVFLLAENEEGNTQLVAPEESGGFGLDAVYNDDFHHTARVALTGRREGFYSDYLGSPQEFVSIARSGYLYQGQLAPWRGRPLGRPTRGMLPWHFVNCLQNHDQVSNSARGQRLHLMSGPGQYRALTAALMLFPQTPLLFQGQEFGASARFPYFADLAEELKGPVREGRRRFLMNFASLATAEMNGILPDPGDEKNFIEAKLDWSERGKHGECYALHRDLLKLRREDLVFRKVPGGLEGAVLGPAAFALRYYGGEAGDRLLLVNFGQDLRLQTAPEPLLAPVSQAPWRLLWSSEAPAYGGSGTVPPESEAGWLLPGRAALVLTSAGTVPPS